MSQKKLGNYSLHEKLGSGGFATVYRSTHANLGIEYAIKILKQKYLDDEAVRERFVREAQTASALEHSNIVRIHDLVNEPENIYLVMDFLPEGDLYKWQSKKDAVSQSEYISILGQIADALDYAHSQENSILHRDVKPSNILMDQHGKAYLSDFGLVQIAKASHLTQIGQVVGTPDYISPEMAESKQDIDGRSDQYSLAIVAYELLVGELPFTGDSPTSVSIMHVTKVLPVPSEINSELPIEFNDVLLNWTLD